MKKWWIAASLIVALIAVSALLLQDTLIRSFFQPTTSRIPDGKMSGRAVETIATNLDTPWSLVLLPHNETLITERSGSIKRLGVNGQIYQIEGVEETSEGGLLGIALHPRFSENSRIYLYFTTLRNNTLTNQVASYTLNSTSLSKQQTILANIPAANNHNGGTIAFGPDNKLYITTGDAAQGNLAQDTSSLAGKILRLNDDGSVPDDNPFDNLVWSYGHRNPQGITWDDRGRLWSVEHGPSGERKGRGKDELNLIDKGINYGWPIIAGDETNTGMRAPVIHSGEDETWAPAGIAYSHGSLFFAGLRGQTLYEARIDDDTVVLSRHFSGKYGRLRAVTATAKHLYFSTSNQDGRGNPQAADDKILRIRRP